RNLQKIMCYTPGQRQLLEEKLKELWDLYQQLKAYKQNPSSEKREQIHEAFDKLFTPETGVMALNAVLKKARTNKAELLAVLDNPQLPLHNPKIDSKN
ncbi:MAG TPA: transposase, partial [Bacteroidia bacterium]